MKNKTTHNEKELVKEEPLDTYLDINDIMKIYKIKDTKAWEKVKEEGFPERIKLTAGCTRWSQLEVQAYIKKVNKEIRQKAA